VGTNRATTEESAFQHLVKLMTILDVKCLSTVRKNTADLRKYTSVPERGNICYKNVNSLY